MKYLRKFNNESEKSAWLNSGYYVSPNVVLTDAVVEYNLKPNPYAVPFFIQAIDDVTVTFSNTYEYSTDRITWLAGTSATAISILAGEKVYFRASGLVVTTNKGIGTFSINGNCNVAGNIMSLVYGADFFGKTTLASYQFCVLFRNATTIVDAGELILPATTLAEYCYSSMFYGCTSLVNAPELPATTLAEYCYSSMFRGCTSLVKAPDLPALELVHNCYYSMFYSCSKMSYVKAMFTIGGPSSSSTAYFLGNVASSGVFVKNAAATWENQFGTNGIPYNWTVETAEA